jgi:outer membrane receptor protein involved in Fe transport
VKGGFLRNNLAIFIAVVVLASSANAELLLMGSVVDISGAPVPEALVTISSGDTVSTLITNSRGKFSFSKIQDIELEIHVVAEGFAEVVRHVSVETSLLRVVLQPAPFTDTVTVTASRGEQRLATAASTVVLTSAELLNSASGALDDRLRHTPGFSLFRRSSSRVANPTTQGVTLRGISGSGASRTRVLVDGLPLNDVFGSWVYWNRVPLASVERVEVVRGAAGDLYGADALGGVIQVLTFQPSRTRVRATIDGGSHESSRISTYAGIQHRGWHSTGAVEWGRNGRVFTIAPEVRGPIDRKASSKHGTGFIAGGYNAGLWRASARFSLYNEVRGNGTPLQVNDTEWKQLSGEVAGSVGGGALQVRVSRGQQSYYQTFTAVSSSRVSERLVRKQTIPSTFSNISTQWTRGWDSYVLLTGIEATYTQSTIKRTSYTWGGVPIGPFFSGGTETSGSGFVRLGFSPSKDFTLMFGTRADFWKSNPRDSTLSTHTSVFLSPRVSVAVRLTELIGLQGSVYQSHRTPTLNELHRGFRVGNVVTNPNPNLDPEHLNGFEASVLFEAARASARVTGFWNQLHGAIANMTLTSTPSLITRQRQNADIVRAQGLEIEADIRPHPRWTLGALMVLTRSHFIHKATQAVLTGNRVPQVPIYQLGTTITYVDPRSFTGSVQIRFIGDQYDDDLNAFKLNRFSVVDVSGSQALSRGVHLFAGVENLFNKEYDVGRTRIRMIGWPRTFRVGLRVFFPQ